MGCYAHAEEKQSEEDERNEVAFGGPLRGDGADRGGHGWLYAPGDEPGAEARNTASSRSGVNAKLPARYHFLCPAGDSGGLHQNALAEARMRKHTVAQP